MTLHDRVKLYQILLLIARAWLAECCSVCEEPARRYELDASVRCRECAP